MDTKALPAVKRSGPISWAPLMPQQLKNKGNFYDKEARLHKQHVSDEKHCQTYKQSSSVLTMSSAWARASAERVADYIR